MLSVAVGVIGYFTGTTKDATKTVLLIVSLVLEIALLVLYIMSMYRLSKCFGHGGGWTVGLVLLPTIFTLMIAFGKSQYQGNIFLKNK